MSTRLQESDRRMFKIYGRYHLNFIIVGLALMRVFYCCASSDELDTLSTSGKVDFGDKIAWAARIKPSERQLAWQELEFTAFIHFGLNTFTGHQWGTGKEDPSVFNPTQLDTDQWVRACRDAGMKMIILTAKHHDGFCLWPSRYTEYSVKKSPWKGGQGDVVEDLAASCQRSGMRLGIYVSPWDRHEPTYGDSQAYNQYFINQLKELLTDYGKITEVWFDGACGEGPNGKRQVYDWDAYYRVVRQLQPDAVIAICGPDVRWCGNEAGKTRDSEWSVIPMLPEGEFREEADPAFGRMMEDGHLMDLGSRRKILRASRLAWFPAEVNTSIRSSWFYDHAEDDKVKSLDELLDIYYRAVGGNAVFLLNIPPDRRGLVHENDARRLREMGQVLETTFKENLTFGAKAEASEIRDEDRRYAAQNILDGDKDSCWMPNDGTTSATVAIHLDGEKTFNTLMLQEAIQQGQRVESFIVEAWKSNAWEEFARSTTIGYKRLLRFDDITTDKVRIRFTESRVCPTLSNLGLFYRRLDPSKRGRE